METKTLKIDAPSSAPAVKKPYEVPVLKEWGTLKDITLSQNSGGRSDGGRKSGTSRTN
jgi:hypothetical protein